MSDIFNDHDYLVEFLNKLARFGIDQCVQFTHLISDKQRSIYQDKRVRNFDLK